MRCSAFCVCKNEAQARIAEEAARMIDRAGHDGAVRLAAADAQVVVIPLEEDSGFPLVHGWLSPLGGLGEYSMASISEGRIHASRDPAGTRPLYVAKSGAWAASDHRFFRGDDGDFVAPGSTWDLASGITIPKVRKHGKYRLGFDDAVDALAAAITRSVDERVQGRRRVAVGFSGGIDSSILVACAKKKTKVIACSSSVLGSRDSVNAPSAANVLDVELVMGDLTEKVVREETKSMDLPFSPTLMDKALWCVYSISARLAAESNCEFLMLGQLADELFGGYAKYQRALAESGPERATEMMREDVSACGYRGFVRDETACSRWVEPRFPFADARVMNLGLSMPVEYKIKDGARKAVLREVARKLGVPEELCAAPKKAAQYSSGIAKLMQ